MKRVHVRPTGGRKIRFPERPSQHLRPEGDLVTLDEFWRGRIADGDVELVPAPSSASAEPRSTPKRRKAAAPPPPNDPQD